MTELMAWKGQFFASFLGFGPKPLDKQGNIVTIILPLTEQCVQIGKVNKYEINAGLHC